MGTFVIAAYAPKPGRQAALLRAIARHLPLLRAEGLVTERPPYVMRATDGTMVEVFEWASAEAVARAHQSPAVQALWAEFGECSDYRTLASLAECQGLFASFEPVEL